MTGKGLIVYTIDLKKKKPRAPKTTDFGLKMTKLKYEGMFKKNYYHGEGLLQYENDSMYKG